MGSTAVLVTVVGSKETSTSSFLPLTVSYNTVNSQNVIAQPGESGQLLECIV